MHYVCHNFGVIMIEWSLIGTSDLYRTAITNKVWLIGEPDRDTLVRFTVR